MPRSPRLPNNPDPGFPRSAEVFFILGAVVLGCILIYLALLLLSAFSSIVLILFLAWLLAFIVSPLVELVSRHLPIPRLAAIALVYLVITAGIAALLLGVASVGVAEVNDFLSRSGETTNRVSATLTGIQTALRLDPRTLDLTIIFQRTAAALGPQLTALLAGQIQSIAGAIVATFGALFIVVILSLYMVTGSQGILDKANRIVPNRYTKELDLVERAVSRAFGGFLRTQIILVLVQVILTTVVMLLFGLPYLFLTGIVSALAMFIPFFGPPFALFPAILVAAAFRPEVFLPVAIILIGVQTILVNFIQPRLMRRSVGMHPVIVVVALLGGAQVAGFWGAIFGIPIVAVLLILVNYFINLRAVAEVEGVDIETVGAELQVENPDIQPEEVLAVAADRAEEVVDAAKAEEAETGALATKEGEAAGLSAVAEPLPSKRTRRSRKIPGRGV